MNLIGAKVKHSIWGIGTVLSITDERIEIAFSFGAKKLEYPRAFETFLQACDPVIQKQLLDTIAEEKKIKKIEEEIKRIEEEAKRKAEEEKRAKEKEEKNKETNKKKNHKTLDEMFLSDYHAEKLAREPILTYEQVESEFGIRRQGFGRGINPTDKTVVLISSINKKGDSFVYHDKWTTDGDYIYSGEGKNGDQTMTKGNLEIKNAKANGKEIHLFVKFSPQEYYYQGIFELVDYEYQDDTDEEGKKRKEYKFRLKKVSPL